MYISSPTRDAEAKTGLGSPAYAVALGGVALAAAAISLASLRTPTAPPLDQTVTFFRFLFEEQLK